MMNFKMNVCLGLLVCCLASAVSAEIFLPDPSIFVEKGTYYLVGTENGDASRFGTAPRRGDAVFPVYVSEDLLTWRLAETPNGDGRLLARADAFGKDLFWAPQLLARGGKYYFAYSCDLSWGIATADSPLGPFKPHAAFPHRRGQTIDPSILQDSDGRVYAYYSDYDTLGGIGVVELSTDLRRAVTRPKQCICNDRPWERLKLDARYEELNRRFGWGPEARYQSSSCTVEGPSVVKRCGKYVLFYSANDFRSPDYCVGAAVADTPLGPWRKLQDGPVLWREQTGLNGTGHGDVFADADGVLWYVFHAHNSAIRISPRRTGLIRLVETVGADGAPRYAADPKTMRLL